VSLAPCDETGEAVCRPEVIIEMMRGEAQLLYSSDYPYWQTPNPQLATTRRCPAPTVAPFDPPVRLDAADHILTDPLRCERGNLELQRSVRLLDKLVRKRGRRVHPVCIRYHLLVERGQHLRDRLEARE
jgi:hypothetical protein